MSEAPERIWINGAMAMEVSGKGWPEYVRVDLYEQRGERIAELEAEIERLKGGIEKWLREGVNKYDTCPHGKMWYEGCEACDESYFAALIAPQEQNNE